ncbi:hypothetical protein MEQU1_002195 [Malassezia equina]|uniref:Uncharacterized protein n=1 Tax=Malassezia equina TaxID=1381935 RepID=A0AAF0EEK1_9BASI|nr:hypothetical protein MEQU1_002195 [Malassezia equina]
MGRPAFEETPAIRLKWFYEILEHETTRLRKRQRSSTNSFRSDVDDLVPIYSPARRLERQRRREANSAFQVDWGLGDQSAIMPLPLESEYATWNGDNAMDEASDEPEEDLMVPSDMNEEPIETATDMRPMARASEPHVIRLRHGQHLGTDHERTRSCHFDEA